MTSFGTSHACQPPSLDEHDPDEDWTCPVCGRDWFTATKNYCHSCGRGDGLGWEPFGTGNGSFPDIRVARGGIVFRGNDDPKPEKPEGSDPREGIVFNTVERPDTLRLPRLPRRR